MKKTILIFLIYSSYVLGVESFSHPSCKYSLIDNQLAKEETTKLKEKLKERGYSFENSLSTKENIKLSPNSMYITTSRIRSGKFYKECLIEINIKQSTESRPLKTDLSLYKNSSLRKFPRQTFKGDERCFMALKDLTFNINYCKTGHK